MSASLSGWTARMRATERGRREQLLANARQRVTESELEVDGASSANLTVDAGCRPKNACAPTAVAASCHETESG